MGEHDPDADLRALQSAGADAHARQARLGELLEEHRARLLRMVELRMDPALRARIGASDVLQESWLEVSNRLDAYLENPRMPFFVWIRFITAQRLLKLHRFHAGAQKRSVGREVREAPSGPEATSIALVDRLMGGGLTPSLVMAEGEFRTHLLAALDEMNPLDREVLVLRHFEEMSNAETARALDIGTDAASKRYIRALERLASVLKKAGIDPSTSGVFPR
jgi:RNA polymerase sigma-70 factor (ECF subfamily)